MRLRRLIMALGLVTILGCSGLSSLLVANKTSRPMHLTLEHEGVDDSPPKKWQGEVQPGERVKTIKWFSSAPREIVVKVRSGEQERRYVVQDETYPRGMQRGSSAKSTYFMDISESGVKVMDPSYFQRMLDQPHVFFAQIIGCLTIVVIVMLPWAAVKLLRKIKSRKP
jgi:hypothetical protein